MKREMTILKHLRLVMILSIVLALGGCLAFYSAHEQFKRGMNTYVKMGRTIDTYNDPKFSLYRPANVEHLTNIEKLDETTDRYHFKRPRFDYYCYYYFDVERSTRKVIGWGFDEHLADPTETCGMSG